MGWKFWKRKEQPKSETYEEWCARLDAEAEVERLRKQAEWDALPDHRKAARIEYQHFQKMASKPAPRIYDQGYLGQMAALQNVGMNNFMPSPYLQMSNEVGKALWLEKGGFL